MNDNGRLIKIEGKVSMLEDKTKDHETRMRDIEKTIWKAFGAVALLNVILFIILSLIETNEHRKSSPYEGAVGMNKTYEH